MRYLRARRQEGFISVIAWFSLIGIALGVATLIVVMAVMNGFRHELLSRILGIDGHLTVYGQTRALTDFEEVARKIAAIPGMVRVTPTIEGEVLARSTSGASGAKVRGMTPADIAKRPILADNITSGSLKNFKGFNAVLLGERLADKLRLRVGDKITLISPKGNSTAFGTVPRMRAYRVVATFKIGHSAYDGAYIFMPMKAAQIYFKLKGAVSYLDVEIDRADATQARMKAIWGNLKTRVRLLPWQRKHEGFFTAIQVERNVMFMILTMIIIVAAFNIVSSMIMLVKDKSTNIAILRTMGATRGMILRIFFLCGVSVGVIGTLAGFLLGLLIAENIEFVRLFFQWLTSTELFSPEIYFLSQLPAIVEPGEVVSVVLMALGLSFLATIYPSWRAARLDPVEVLRYE